jgi:DNA-binding IclR family transcriptional regulator
MSSRSAKLGASVIALPTPSNYSAPALEKGLDIFECLAASPSALGLSDIALQLGRSTSEIYRMLEVLVARQYLQRDGSGLYSLSLKLFELSHHTTQQKQLLEAALPVMKQLAEQTRQSNHLVVAFNQRIVVIAQVDSPEAMGFAVRLGAHFPFRSDRVSARTLAAFQTQAMRDQMLAAMLKNDTAKTSKTSLTARVDAIAKRGYEQQTSDTLPGITDICFPILNGQGHAVATLTQPYLKQRDVMVNVAQAKKWHRLAAAAISQAVIR